MADDVYFRPKHPYTQILIDSNPEPDPRIAQAAHGAGRHGRDPVGRERRRGVPVRQPLSRKSWTCAGA